LGKHCPARIRAGLPLVVALNMNRRGELVNRLIAGIGAPDTDLKTKQFASFFVAQYIVDGRRESVREDGDPK
jgi:hypothetical protein